MNNLGTFVEIKIKQGPSRNVNTITEFTDRGGQCRTVLETMRLEYINKSKSIKINKKH